VWNVAQNGGRSLKSLLRSAGRSRPWSRSPLPRWLVRSTLAVAPLQRGPDLVGLQLGHRPLVALGGLPAALPQSAGDDDPVALGQGVGQVLGLPAPHADLQERGVAIASPSVLGIYRMAATGGSETDGAVLANDGVEGSSRLSRWPLCVGCSQLCLLPVAWSPQALSIT
jgi:hypothetical protein